MAPGQRAEQLSHGLDAIRREDRGAPLAGTVRISAGEGFLRPLTRVLARFREEHPETTIELLAEARFVDLSRREADLGIRLVRSTSEVLVERPLGEISFGLFASERYLTGRLPSAVLGPGGFASQDFLGFDGPLRRLPQERWLVACGAQRFPFRSNSDVALLAAAAEGQGICVAAAWLGRDAGLTPVRLGPSLEPLPGIAAWLVSHRDLRALPRVRAVADAVGRAFRETFTPPARR